MDRKSLEALAVHLKKGEVAIVPFDTCYGLICDGTNPNACAKLYQLKERSRHKPSALVLPSVEEVENYAILSTQQKAILNRILPGPVTVILRLKEGIELPLGFAQTKYGTASFRVVKTDLINKILASFKKPLLATSANITDRPVILSRTDFIMHPFNKERVNRVFQVLDEVYHRPAHSTVVDLTTDIPEVVREGVIPTYEIMQAA